MTPEQKKKIAKWMGWEWIDRLHIKDQHGNYIYDGSEFSPDTDANCWFEIFERMTEDDWNVYWEVHHKEFHKIDPKIPYERWVLVCPLDIRCKALLKVIEGEV
jgi:hypothetical protein